MKKSLGIKAIAIVIMLISVLTISSGLFESSAAWPWPDIASEIAASAAAKNSGAVDPSTLTGGSVGTEKLQGLGNQAITIVSVLGSIVSVIVLIVLGLKYMMGSTEEKAEYKKTLMPYVIGAILVFAASAVAGVIFSVASGVSTTIGS